MKERWGFPVLLLTAVSGVFGAGLAWMTHMHHRALQYIAPGRMAEFDAGYERLSDLTVIPAGVVGVAGSVLLLWLRPKGVPVWMIVGTLALQLSVFVTRIWWWGAWAEEVREAGAVWRADGGVHEAYSRYMDTNGIRIAVITAYALSAAGMVFRAFQWQRSNAHASV